MSTSKTGALIVIGRVNELKQTIETGELLDAQISEHLLENIFYKNTPLHDGAVIILNGRIRAARCILPVSKNTELPGDLGLRHRAAVGITEQSDAIAVIVSEQRGDISFCVEGKLSIGLMPAKLKHFIEKEMES
jgi:DNA integrity scanning protein DisA with diadenylate cyclase activity